MSYRDAHRIARKLWIGAAPFDCDGLEHFDVIVLCARELQWIPTPCEAIRVPLDDGSYPRPPAQPIATRPGETTRHDITLVSD